LFFAARAGARKGPMAEADPLAFKSWALAGLLVNQVSPPKLG
jgi:hypothetical protein